MTRKRRSSKSGSRWGSRQDRSEPDSDYLLDAANRYWPYILTAYKQFEDKRPVMLLDIQEGRIYVYPYAEFRQELSEKSQQSLKDQYERAIQENKIVVFVRDNEQRRLVSYSMDYE